MKISGEGSKNIIRLQKLSKKIENEIVAIGDVKMRRTIALKEK